MKSRNQSEGSERIIQVLGCDDCTRLGHDEHLVSVYVVVVARLGADVAMFSIASVSERIRDRRAENKGCKNIQNSVGKRIVVP